MRSLQLPRCALLLFFSWFAQTPGQASHLFISEFLTAGNETFEDEDGDTPDWLEIRNPTAGALDLEGHFLTDDPANLAKWQFPEISLDPGDYLVVFASDKNRATAGSELHTNFRLTSDGEYLALVEPDGTTILHEYVPAFPPQTSGYSYGVAGLAPDDAVAFFAEPTPGAPNRGGLATPLAAPEFSVKCATFTDTIEVALETAFPGGEIRYTTDGNVPSASSTLYTAPLTIRSTTRLRARVFNPESGDGGEVDTAFYTQLDPRSNLDGIRAPTQFSSTLPILVLENFGTGNIPNPGSALKYTQISVFEVDPLTGRASLASPPDDCLHSGMRIRGASSSGFAKKQYRVEIWNEDSESRNVSLLGLPSENDWVFGAPYVDEALMRNPLIFELGREMGLAASRTRYCEVFLNTDGGPLTAADYQGVYYVADSIKIDENRVDVTPLDTLAADDPDGGYIIRHEAGVANKTRIRGWNQLEIHDPEPVTPAQRDFISDYVNEFDRVLRTPRAGHPEFGYRKYIDVPSFINTIVINEFVREQDDYVRSAYLHKDRGGKLVNGPLWDYNLSFGVSCCFNSHLTGVDPGTGSGWQFDHAYNRGARENGVGDNSHNAAMTRFDWYRLLLDDPDFMQAFIDRYQELRSPGNLLDIDEFHARVDRFADTLDGTGGSDSPAARNFLKWRTLGSQQTGFQNSLPPALKNSQETWDAHVQFIKGWAVDRLAWMDSQFDQPPVLSPAGGGVVAGTEVIVSSAHPVYYTTDGSDPRLAGGEINPDAKVIPPTGGGIVERAFLSRGSEWSFRDDGSDLGPSDLVTGHPAFDSNNWKHPDFDESAWSAGPAILGLGALGTDTTATTELESGPPGDAHLTYYLRKRFTVADVHTIDSLTLGILRDDGAIVYLNGEEIVRTNMPDGVVGYQDLASSSVGRGDETVFNFFTLDPTDLLEGENVLAVELHQDSAGSTDLGFDLELKGIVTPEGLPTITVDGTTRVRARSFAPNREWSAPTEAVFVTGTPADASNVIVSEINYHPPDPSAADLLADPTLNDDDFEWLELRNISDGPVELSGARFVAGIAFDFPVGTVLEAGGRLVIVENLSAFERRYGNGLPVAGVYSNKLDNDGDTVRLLGADRTEIAHFTFNDIWYRATDGEGFTLVAADESRPPLDASNPASWGVSSQILGTPGVANGNIPSITFDSWLEIQFTAAERADPAISGFDADFDHDGLTTLMEFGLGLDPKSIDSAGLPAPSVVEENGESYLTLTFRRQKNAPGLGYRIEASPDLLDWMPFSGVTISVVDNGDGATESITVRSNLPVESAPHRFLRLVVERE